WPPDGTDQEFGKPLSLIWEEGSIINILLNPRMDIRRKKVTPTLFTGRHHRRQVQLCGIWNLNGQIKNGLRRGKTANRSTSLSQSMKCTSAPGEKFRKMAAGL